MLKGVPAAPGMPTVWNPSLSVLHGCSKHLNLGLNISVWPIMLPYLIHLDILPVKFESPD